MKKQTNIVDVRLKRSIEEIRSSIDIIKAKILSLNLGAFRYSHTTPPSIPDIDVIVLEDKVIAKYLCDDRVITQLRSLIGFRLVEYVESSLLDTYNHMLSMKQNSEVITKDLIKKVAVSTKQVMDNGKTPEIYKEKETMHKKYKKVEYPKHKLKINRTVPFYTPPDHAPIKMVRVILKVRNKSDDEGVVNIGIFKKNEKGEPVRMDTINGTLKPDDKGTIQLVIPSDCVLIAKAFHEGIRIQIDTILDEHNRDF